jgi:hypothetical protein
MKYREPGGKGFYSSKSAPLTSKHLPRSLHDVEERHGQYD